MSEINPISDLLEHHRALLEEAEADIERANDSHRKVMEELQRTAALYDSNHKSSLQDAVTRKMKAEGAIAALEELSGGQ
jgi:multidrug resistance efflux pump